MIDDPHDNQARFRHTFSSPLTAIRGAIDLLRHRRRLDDDQTTRELIETLERNYKRLNRTIDILLRNVHIGDDTVEIHAPLDLFGIVDQPAPDSPASVESATIGTSDSSIATPEEPHALNTPDMIVVIADRSEQRDTAHAALHGAGYYVLAPNSGVEGIDVARERHPDLIVIDYQLALPGAAQVAKILRDDPDTKTIPLIFIADRPLTPEPPLQQIELVPLNDAPEALVALVSKRIDAARASVSQAATLLIVDDDADIQRIVMLRLQQDGYRVVQATNGAEALIAAQKQTFDLIILDLLLPDIDGFSVLGALRARTATATTPIILLSARDSAPEKVRGFQLGADDYVTKPFSPAELQARVRAALRRYEREAGANPSTRLPGNIAIEQTLRRRIEQNVPFAVCYADLDNFKAYNDTYSFLKGDAIIQQTAHVLLEAVEQAGNPDDFVGHIGGDDFVVITSPASAERIASAAIEQFDLLSPLFYDPATRKRGYIDAHDRQGRPTRYPFVSLSIAIVSNARHPIQHVAEVAQRSVEPKKRAKDLPGSVYVIED
jgi:PleD family two-component response regulator